MNDNNATMVSMASFWVAFIAFLAASLLGLYQVVERSGLFPSLESHELYFASVSTHGVLMAFVLTTFVVMGFGNYTATTSLGRPLWGKQLAWVAFLVALAGTITAAVPLLSGKASVLYTFYPPMRAHPAFYIGATLLVVGSWIWCLQMIMSMVAWKKDNPGELVPLAMFGTVANAIMWLWTSAGVASEMLFQLIPWSLGWKETVDAGLARTLFSWTLHAIVYFWLFPVYIAMYTLLPKAAGGRLFSDEMGRISFIMLLVISVPIGFHHLYVDPQQAAGFKMMHMVGTFLVAVPTLLTGFTVIASLENAGRLRGGTGLFGWIPRLPFGDPLVLSAVYALLMLVVGGWGGLVNASYSMNTLVHNTQFVTGHFHLIFGGTVVIMYLGIAYHLWPRMTGRALRSNRLALVQLSLWFAGMIVTAAPWHILGLLGQPRRVSSTPYDSPLVADWTVPEAIMVVGGAVLTLSALMFVFNLANSHRGRRHEIPPALEYALPIHAPVNLPPSMNGFGLWNAILLIWMMMAYGYPVMQFFMLDTHGSLPWGFQ